MADRIYLSARYSTEQTLRLTERLRRAGFDTGSIRIYPTVGLFAQTLRQGDRVVVSSLGVFEGVGELMAALHLFFRAGCSVYSVREALLCPYLTPKLVEELYRTGLHGVFDQPGSGLTELDPTLLHQFERVRQLVRDRQMSISRACSLSGCSRNVYYYYKRKGRLML